jgi:hypothetical protein
VDLISKAFVPQFPGLSIEELLAEFGKKYPVTDYLLDQEPTLKVPRGFILDVQDARLTGWPSIRTVVSTLFRDALLNGNQRF